jgi:hypothetical protein
VAGHDIPATRLTVELSAANATIGHMDRSGFVPDARLRRSQQTWTASRRMIARRERPGYRVAETGDGVTVHVVELPWLGQIVADRSEAVRKAREAIAAWLEVDPDSFDVEWG